MRCLKHISKLFLGGVLLLSSCMPAYAVLPTIFATQPSGNVAASLLDQNYTFLESQGVQGLTTTGGSNAYVATPQDAWVTGYTSYVARALTVIPNFTNSAAATVNVSGLGAASIYKNVSGVATALASGDMVSGVPAILICDGTGFLLANPTPASGGGGGGGSMVLLNSQTISTSTPAVMDTTHITSAYSHYRWECSNLTSVTNNVNVYFTVQQGGSFIGGGNYNSIGFVNGTHNQVTSTDQMQPLLNNTSVQASPNISVLVIDFWNPSLSQFLIGTYSGNVQTLEDFSGAFFVDTQVPTTGIKLAMSSGNIATALCNLYGIQ